MPLPLAPKKRNLPDWIEGFMDYTVNRQTSIRYRKWVAMSGVGGALTRRCWIKTASGRIFPNTYIMLVGKPATGKDQAINPMRNLWKDLPPKKLRVGASSMSAKGIIDTLSEEKSEFDYVDPESNVTKPFCSVIGATSELGIMIPEYNPSQISIMTELWGANNEMSERTRNGTGSTVTLTRPVLHLLLGTQPDFFGTTFPQEAFGMGFFARTIMIFEELITRKSLWDEGVNFTKLRRNLLLDLTSIANMQGPFSVTEEVKDKADEWFSGASLTDGPTHGKLEHYKSRRFLHAMKLAMAFSASRSDNRVINSVDWDGAIALMFEAEDHMHKIFSSMQSSKGIAAELDEISQLVRQYKSSNARSIPEHKLVRFLAGRVPANQIAPIIDASISAHVLSVVGVRANSERLFTLVKGN